MVINVYFYSCKVPKIRKILMQLEFPYTFSKNNEISNFMKIRSVGPKLFHSDGWTDRHDEAKSRFSKCCKVPRNLT